MQFHESPCPQILGEVAGGESCRTVRCSDEYHPMALGGSTRHGSSCQKRLIIRMSMDEHQGSYRLGTAHLAIIP